MIRPVTCVCFVLACGSGLYLYQAKHRVQVIEREIEKTVRSTDEVRDRIRILHAEWTLQNDPQRLQGLADQLLSLKTVAPGQFTSMAELNNRLPAVRPPEPPPAEPSAAPTPQIEEPPPVAAIAPGAPPPAPPGPKPAVVAAAPPPRPPEQHKAAPPPPPRPVVAEAAPVRQAAPPPRPIMATAEPVRQVIAPTPVAATTGSALGMARSASAPPPPRPMPVNASPWFNNGGGGG